MKKYLLLLATSFNVEANLVAKIAPGYKAFIAYGDKNFTAAESAYAQNLETDPYDMTANYNLGTTLYKQNKFTEAKHHFERSVKSISTNDSLLERSLFNLGNCCMQLAEYQEAIDAYEKVLQLSPNDDRAQKNLELARSLLEEQNRKKEEEKKQEKDSEKDCDKQKDQQKDDQDKDQKQGKDKSENKPGKKNKDESQQQDKSKGNDQKDSNQQSQKDKESGDQGDDEQQEKSMQDKSDQKDSDGEKKDQKSDKDDSESADGQQSKKNQNQEQDLKSEQDNLNEKKDQGLQKSKEEEKLTKEASEKNNSEQEQQKNKAGSDEKKIELQNQYAAQMNADPGVDDRLNEREGIVLKALSDQENAIQKQLLRMNVSKEGVKHEKNW